jgi:hypothetical protein
MENWWWGDRDMSAEDGDGDSPDEDAASGLSSPIDVK